MPDLTEGVKADIESRLAAYLEGQDGYGKPSYIGSGGSAAIYRVETAEGSKAIKVYDPKFFSGGNAKAEERRLKLQQSLIGHECETLISVEKVVEAYGTGFIEMEFVAWPQLKSVLSKVPDDRVTTLIRQLVEAAVYLEKIDIVHRDIKPENIHVAEDFSKLKLIDLGVARYLLSPDEEAEEATDHGHIRPFIATAQYSSPEYLFRLDAPSSDLWKALNLYQVGAVLHDMINKKPLFEHEVGLGNKWLVARAVLTKVPNFPDTDVLRLASLKALAARCLVKDMTTRLQIVGWTDFEAEAPLDALAELKAKLAKGRGLAGSQVVAVMGEKLRFERNSFAKRFCEFVRTELIAACDGGVTVLMSGPGFSGYTFDFSIGPSVTLMCGISFSWLDDMQSMSANVDICGVIKSKNDALVKSPGYTVAVATINSSEDVVATDVARRIAEIISAMLNMLDSGSSVESLHGTDVAKMILRMG